MDEDLVGAIRLEPAEQFDNALLGKADINGQTVLVYDYNLIVEGFAREFADEDAIQPTDDQWSDALEWVEFNTIRGIQYMGDRRPLIVYRDIDLEESG
jgi:hypothetical protein